MVANWRIAKGMVAEEGFAVAKCALKACGTSNTTFSGTVSRMYRDLTMGLVQAFPAERGRLGRGSRHGDRHRVHPVRRRTHPQWVISWVATSPR
ncbi:MAG: hypothetical protein R2789_01285 [Microthrixaceae bacterium]